MSDNLLPEFYRLLREANDASEAVDDFDLNSKDIESKKEWNKLLQTQAETNKALIEYIRDNPQVLPQVLNLCKPI